MYNDEQFRRGWHKRGTMDWVSELINNVISKLSENWVNSSFVFVQTLIWSLRHHDIDRVERTVPGAKQAVKAAKRTTRGWVQEPFNYYVSSNRVEFFEKIPRIDKKRNREVRLLNFTTHSFNVCIGVNFRMFIPNWW